MSFTEEKVAIDLIRPREGNRPARKVEELAAAIKADGQLNRILLRRTEGGFVLIGGERRLRAHQHLGLTSIDAKVYDVDDEKAQELADLDNLQREDYSPIEEGEAYHRLLDIADSVGDVARRAGRSEQHVRQRMRLALLHDPIRAMVAADQLDIGAAELIAQTPDAVQRKLAPLLKQALSSRRWDQAARKEVVVTFGRVSRQVVQELLERHAHELADAPFAIADATLVPAAGACGVCPKRTGVQGVLVEVLDATDTCLDDECWGGKVKAHRARVIEDARKKGLKVLSDAETQKTLSHEDRTRHDSKFKSVSETIWKPDGTEIPVAKLVDDTTPRTLAFTEHGHVVELVPREVVDAALKGRSKAEAKAGPGASKKKVESAQTREQRKAREKAELLKRSAYIALRQVQELVEGGRVSIETVLRVAISETGLTLAETVAKARGVEKAISTTYVDALDEVAAGIVDDQRSEVARVRHLAALVAQLAVVGTIHTSSYAVANQATPPALKAFDVDLAACRRAAEGELRAEAEQKAAKKHAPKGTPPAAGKKSTKAPAKTKTTKKSPKKRGKA